MTGETHADSLAIPEHITAKNAFYKHVAETLAALVQTASEQDESDNLVTVASNAASLLFGSFENFDSWGPAPGRRVNWAGFYFHPKLLSTKSTVPLTVKPNKLILGPFHGRPACNSVSLTSKTLGVCAAAFDQRQTVVVPDVNARPGHIACDGVTQSEIVVPIIVNGTAVGVLDIDCEGLDGFTEDIDRPGLEEIVSVFIKAVDWPIA
ncbi:hypothetical protein OIV83_001388 [Microbotryomycetes sp. JL201]|nr:hypothetical protein OIV83_001388 [Microbotryomycetes sp. JL201]